MPADTVVATVGRIGIGRWLVGEDNQESAKDSGGGNERDESAVDYALARRRLWQSRFRLWIWGHYGGNMSAIALTVLTTLLSAGLYGVPDSVITVMAAAAVVIVAALAYMAPSKQARSYLAAWRTLDGAWGDWLQVRDSGGDLEAATTALIAAVMKGEEILAGKEPW